MMVELGVNVKTEDKYICSVCYIDNVQYCPYPITPLTALCDFCGINQAEHYIKLEIDSKFTPCCGKEMKLKLFPDYCSSGIWCFHCGCNLSSLQIPDGLIDLCGIWNDMWDHQINSKFYFDDKYFAKVFISTGKYLCELINQYCYCEFNITEDEIIQDVIKERKR